MKRLFVPLWAPPEESYAGGFLRARRIVECFRAYEPHVVASDSFPIFTKYMRRYPSRTLQSDASFTFKFARGINWVWSTLCIIALGLLSKEKYDAVYAGPSEILPISLGGLVVGKIRKIPIVFCSQNVRDTEFWPINRLVHNAGNAIITVSEALAQELRDERIAAPIFVGTNGVDDYSLLLRAAQYDGIFVGRHTEAKGIFDLLHAWRLVCDARPNSQLVCAGPITPSLLKQIQNLLSELRLQNAVTICGPVDENRKWELYSCSRVCVFPSRVEGWGMVPIEAQLAGLPIVAYNLPAYAATIATSPGATLTPAGDIHSFADAIVDELAAPSNDSQRVRQWAKQFTWSAAVEREEQILDRILRSL